MIRLGETGIYFPSLPTTLIDEVSRRTIKHIDGLRIHADTEVKRSMWHNTQDTGVNFLESPLGDSDFSELTGTLGLTQRMLKPFETGTVSSALVFGSIREHNDQRTLGYSDLRTLFFPLSLPDGLAQFGTGQMSSLEFTQPLKPGAAVCFDQNTEHHLLFDAQKALGTGVVIFVTRESYESLMWSIS
ncbi:hypothetical protein KBC86_00775 [Candidatus Gracilibacteria bacterium]|nr:hypothetical protein [Candidatus Gracilibacteria bacterium]